MYSPKTITREQWGALVPRHQLSYTQSKLELIIHYSTGQELGRLDIASWMREIDRHHKNTNDWSGGFGYNFAVDALDNQTIWEGRGWDAVGAHCPEHNTVSIGVVFLGNDDPDVFDVPPHTLRDIRWIWEEANRRYGRQLQPHAHRDFRQTQCPGRELHEWILGGMKVPDQLQPLVMPACGIEHYPLEADRFWEVAEDGGVFSINGAPFYGSMGGKQLAPGEKIVGMAAHPSGQGYWLASNIGGVMTFGNIKFHGSAANEPTSAKIRGIAADPFGRGYRLVHENGNTYDYGVPYVGRAGA